MAISKKKDSPYYYTRFSLCGVRVQESTRTNSRREAQEYEEKRRKEIREHVLFGKKPKRTWLEAQQRWLEENKHKSSALTSLFILEWLDQHLNKYSLEQITKDVIEEVARKKLESGVKPATVNRTLTVISSILNKACKDWEWIDKIPVIKKIPEPESRIRYITKEEAERLLNNLHGHLRDMAQFSLATGLRAGNVKYLEWEQVNMQTKHVHIEAQKMKNKKSLGIPLNESAMEVLRRWQGKHPIYVFVYQGHPVSQCSTKAWRKALQRAGIKDFRWHDLRHTWASWHVQNGTTLQELSELGGWSSFNMVLRYAHLTSNHLQQAADRISKFSGAESVQKKNGEEE